MNFTNIHLLFTNVIQKLKGIKKGVRKPLPLYIKTSNSNELNRILICSLRLSFDLHF